MSNIRGHQAISGTHGKLWWDGELVAEIESFEAKITANRETVQIGMDEDSKIVGLKGEGTIKFKKFYTRGKKKFLEAWKKGEDPRSKIVSKISDPGAVGKQSESGSLDNVWFNEFLFLSFEKGKPVEEEFPFGFTPSDADYIDTIEVR